MLDLFLEHRFELIVSPKLLAELSGVLLRERFRRYVTTTEVRELTAALAAAAVVAPDPLNLPSVARDPGDDYLVALAFTTRADALVSGDRDLTDLVDVGVPVLTPRAFLDRVEPA